MDVSIQNYTVAPVTPIAIAGNKTSDVCVREDLQVQDLYRFRKCYRRYTLYIYLNIGNRNINPSTLPLANVAVGTYVVDYRYCHRMFCRWNHCYR
jgi:hypothetical protein